MENNDKLNLDTGRISDQKDKSAKGGKGAARQTLYRVTLRNQLRSISIADQKANILIGINTILISIIIAILGIESSLPGSGFISELDLSIPFTLFLVACFGSAFLAVLAVRPMSRPWKSDAPRKLFFKDYRHMDLQEFNEFMGDVTESGDNIYETLNTDMFLFGQNIVRKYHLLRLAYGVFTIGLACMVLSFLIIRIIE